MDALRKERERERLRSSLEAHYALGYVICNVSICVFLAWWKAKIDSRTFRTRNSIVEEKKKSLLVTVELEKFRQKIRVLSHLALNRSSIGAELPLWVAERDRYLILVFLLFWDHLRQIWWVEEIPLEDFVGNCLLNFTLLLLLLLIAPNKIVFGNCSQKGSSCLLLLNLPY